MPELCVVNASPLIFLGSVGRLELLRPVARRICVPELVYQEVTVPGPSDPSVAALLQAIWIERAPVVPSPERVLVWDLGPGESAVLSMALGRAGTIALLDDLQARRCAASFGIPVVGTLGLILSGKRRGEIERARPILEELRARGMWLSDRILDAALREVGE